MKNPPKHPAYGPVMMLAAALCFSLGGVLCKFIPWSGFALNGGRNAVAAVVMGLYIKMTHHPFKFNKTVLFGSLWTVSMSTAYIIANKLTTAANAIVLEYTSPVWIILLMMLFFGRKPTKKELITVGVIAVGILCFFFDSLAAGSLLGDFVALLSGLFYANVFLLNSYEDGDAMSSLLLGMCIGGVCLSPFAIMEADHSPTVLVAVLFMGIVQVAAAYIFFALGTECTPPVTASLIATIEPVVNPILVAAIFGEFIQPLSLLGAAIVIVTVLIYNISNIKEVQK